MPNTKVKEEGKGGEWQRLFESASATKHNIYSIPFHSTFTVEYYYLWWLEMRENGGKLWRRMRRYCIAGI
jgi:hypothetical protein